jgi:DNA-binding MarR family transcriptional regulator
MKNEGYINIQGWMINDLQLNGNELLLFAVIYGFSQDGKSQYRGSLTYIENALKISRRTIIRILQKLVDQKLIKKEFNSTGNLYSANLTLLARKGVTKCHQSSDKMSPVSSDKSIHNNNKYNNKDNNNTSNEVAYVIKLFEKLDVKNKTYYKNKTQRTKVEFLIREHGVDRLEQIIDVYLKCKGDRFLPSISSPYEMVEKWSKLADFFQRKKSDQDSIMNNVIF